jgi:phosphoribosylaminoimidazole-succinocarboxamide synthase
MAIGFRSLFSREKQAPRRRQVFQGSRKTLFDGPEPGTFVLQFKDDVSIVGMDPLVVEGKGAINNRVSALLMSRLNDLGINTHLIRRLNMREQLVCAAEIIPVRVSVHNVAVDHFAERLGLELNQFLPKPIVEFSYHSRDLGYPVISAQHIEALDWLRLDEIDEIVAISQRINDFLSGHFFAMGLRLLNFTLEFGRLYRGDYFEDSQIILIDELTQDTCSLMDVASGMRFDHTMAEQEGAFIYQTVAERLGLLNETNPSDAKVIYDEKEDDDGDV